MLLRLILLCAPTLAFATPTPVCQSPRLADTGWTDISATTAVAYELLEAKGYTPKVSLLSLAITYAGLANDQVDFFLGNWMPSQEADIRKYRKEGSIEVISKNLEGATYTLAVPDYVYNSGVQTFDDLKKFPEKFERQIYGIEAGNDGNDKILKMIKRNSFGLKGWQIIESSEQGMLSSVKQAMKNKSWIVFLGWSPHPMNMTLDAPIKYLDGGDRYFGKNFGEASVYTVARAGYSKSCPEVAGFLKRLKFNIKDENELMSLILNDGLSPKQAAKYWLSNNLDKAQLWLGTGTLASKHFNYSSLNLKEQNPSFSIGLLSEQAMNYLINNYSNQILFISKKIESSIQAVTNLLLKFPPLLLTLLISASIYSWRKSIFLGLGVCSGFICILNLGLWTETIQTLVLVLIAAFLACLIGTPLGVACAKSKKLYQVMRPVLDLMQTLPTFVYLIPTLMLFGLGVVPGLISTLIFAVAAPIRLTHLGISQVPKELIEAGEAFGASKWQIFKKIELRHAMPSLLAGLNQCILLSLSMVVIAALVGAEGLGTPVIRALNTVNLKQDFEAGLAIVILAIILDRSLQGGKKSS